MNNLAVWVARGILAIPALLAFALLAVVAFGAWFVFATIFAAFLTLFGASMSVGYILAGVLTGAAAVLFLAD